MARAQDNAPGDLPMMMMCVDVVQAFENILVVCHTDGLQELRQEPLLEENLPSLPCHEDLETLTFERPES